MPALIDRIVDAVPEGTTTFTLPRVTLLGLITETLDLPAALADGAVSVAGDPRVLERLVALVAPIDPAFDIVTP